ncbi:MAG: hypothetical protein Q7T77_07755 [Sulfuricurvum sp.]|nr:hypothetical protein [Sulfuricurvum sp.]
MAKRPVYFVGQSNEIPVISKEIEFHWFAGMAKSQKQKSIQSLHQSIYDSLDSSLSILEISSKSENELGVQLSAFNLSFALKNGQKISVENAFQGGKVFTLGGPYKDLYEKTSMEAKQDPRLKESGSLVKFVSFNDEEWPLTPKTLFYDWIYLKALKVNPELAKQVIDYDVFTDIEFNPEKSINCQAYSAALYVYLFRNNLLDILNSRDEYLKFVTCREYNTIRKIQNTLL